MLRRLYDWTLSLAARKSAEWWLAIIAFVESSVFLVPADVLFLPMALSRPDRAYRYALVATVASVLGGIAGWFLGHYAYEAIAKPVLEFYGKLRRVRGAARSRAGSGLILLMLVTSGLAHLPPIKVVTILSGVIGFSSGCSSCSAIVARGARFFPRLAAAAYGEPIRHFIENRLGLIAGGGAAALILLYILVRYVHLTRSRSRRPDHDGSRMTASLRPHLPPRSGLASPPVPGARHGGHRRRRARASSIIGGYIPCKLCLEQRMPYYVGAPLMALAAAVVGMAGGRAWLRGLLAAGGLLMAYGLYLGVYHAGVEWGWWPGPTDCGAVAAWIRAARACSTRSTR